MNITVDLKTLANALADVLPFAPVKSPVAVLKFAKITTKGNRMKIEANDMQAAVRKYITATEIDADGSFLVECEALAKFIAKCKGDIIQLIVDAETLTVKHSKGKASFQVMKTDDYVDFKFPTNDITEITLPGAMLAECVNIAKGFVGTDDLRPQMKPIYAYVKDGEFGYCATDTRKLVHDKNAIDVAAGIDVHWYIEPFVFSALSKSCKGAETVEIRVTPTHVSYRMGDTTISTMQTEGNYPAFERVIPKDWAMECAVDKLELSDSLSRVALFCEDSRLVKFDVSRMDMTISADNTAYLKKSSESIPHNGCNGEIKIGMQADYLTTCLGSCTANELMLRMTDAARPMMIHQAEKPNLTVLLMPMVVN